MSPGREVVDPRSGMDGGDVLEGCLVVGVGIHAIRVRRFGERSDPAPGRPPLRPGLQRAAWRRRRHQVIVARGVTDQPADAAHFAPMLQRVSANVGAAPEHATGDAGYWNPQVEAQARALGTEAWVATERVRHGDRGPGARTGDASHGLDPRERMRWRLDTPEGRARYARRKAVVEPVNGQIKHARRFRHFSMRGLDAVDA